MAEFRIDQATPGAGTPGVARHDLVPGEVITLTATGPVGPGVTYAWEILDKVGSPAVLSAPTGASVTIGPAPDITQPCAFRIRLTADDNGIVTAQTRIASVRTAAANLRVPLFAESAPSQSTLASNNPAASDDNAVYPDRAGLGSAEQNWRGWAEWAYELTLYADSLAGGGPPTGAAGGDLGGTYPNPDVVRLRGRTIHTTAPSDGDVMVWNATDSRWEPAPPASGGGGAVFTFQPGGTPSGNIYDDWAALHAAASAIGRGVVVILDGQFGLVLIPPGTWNVNGWEFRGRVPPDGFSVLREALVFDDGCVLVGNQMKFVGVNIDDFSTAPVFDLATAGLAARFEFVNSYVRGSDSTTPLIAGATNTDIYATDTDIGPWVFRADMVPLGSPKDLRVFVRGRSTLVNNAFSGNGYTWWPDVWRLFLFYDSSAGYDSGIQAGMTQDPSGPWAGWDPSYVTGSTALPTLNEPALNDVMTWNGTTWEASPPSGGGGGGKGDTTMALNAVVTTLDTEVLVGGNAFVPVLSVPVYFYFTGYAVSSGTVEIRLYALNYFSGPGPDDLRATLTLTASGDPELVGLPLTYDPAPSAPGEILDDGEMYEVRVHIAGGSPGDVVHVLSSGFREL
jgi:hypothetical protein